MRERMRRHAGPVLVALAVSLVVSLSTAPDRVTGGSGPSLNCLDDVDDTAEVQDLLDAGGTVELPQGECLTSSPLRITRPTVLRGVAGRFKSSQAPNFGTQVRASSKTFPVIVMEQSAGSSRIEDLSTIGGNTGIVVKAAAKVSTVTVQQASGDGLAIDTRNGGNANGALVEHVTASDNGRHGFYVDGGDSNAVTIDATTAIDNAGYGYYLGSTQMSKVDRGVAEKNLTGAYYVDGSSNMITFPYIEGGTGNKCVIGPESHYGIWMGGWWARCELEGDPASRGWLVHNPTDGPTVATR